MMRDDIWGYETTEERCPYCGAFPFEPCKDMRGGYETGATTTGENMPADRRLKRIHRERRPES